MLSSVALGLLSLAVPGGSSPPVDHSAWNAAAPLALTVQNGHGARIFSLAFSADGRYLVSGSQNDKTIKLWTVDGRLLNTFRDNDWFVYCVAFSPDGRQIASGDQSVRLYNLDGSEAWSHADHNDFVSQVAFSPDGKLLASRSQWRVLVWHRDGTLTQKIDEPRIATSGMSFSPDGKSILVTLENGVAKTWPLGGKTAKSSKIGSKTRAIFGAGARELLSFESDTVELLTSDGKGKRKVVAKVPRITDAALSPDGQTIATTSWDGKLRLWDRAAKLQRTIAADAVDAQRVTFSPDGSIIATGGGDQTIKLWNADGALLRVLGTRPHTARAVAPSPDGSYLVSSAADELKLWARDLHLGASFGKQWGIESVAWHPDGRRFVSGGGKTVKIWDREKGLLHTVETLEDVRKLAVSPDGARLAIATWGRDVLLSDFEGGPVRALKGHTDFLYAVAFMPDGRLLSSAADGTVRVWSKEGTLAGTIETVEVPGHIAVSPDGSCFAFVGRIDIQVWGIATKKKGAILQVAAPMKNEPFGQGITFTPDGRSIALGSGPNLKIWKLPENPGRDGAGFDQEGSAAGSVLRTLVGPPGHVDLVRFIPGGKLAVSTDRLEDVIRIWNLETGESVALIALEAEWLAYSPDGYYDGSRDGGRFLAMVKGMRAFGVDQFAIRNNRPDILLQRLGLGDRGVIEHYQRIHQKRLRRLGLSESQLSAELHAPEAVLSSVAPKGKQVELSVELSDGKYPLKSYNVFVNDVPLFGAYGKPVSGMSARLSERIELTRGANKIEVSCLNDRGAESFRALSAATYTGTAAVSLHVLAFGVSRYRDPTLNLRFAHKDAQDLSGAFQAMGAGGFERVDVHTFVDEQVTRGSIHQAKALLQRARPDDILVLFIAGHGVHDGDAEATYYYLTHEAELGRLSETAAKFDDVEDLLQSVAPRNKLFLLDTCESGELDEDVQSKIFAQAGSRGIRPRSARGIKAVRPASQAGSGSGSGRPYVLERDRYIYNDVVRRSGAIVFSSSRGNELSYERDDFENGVFTEELLGALRSAGADKNHDGTVDVRELRAFVSQAVAAATEGMQNPTVDRDNLFVQFGFPILR